ncbi:MAG: hypothetical protein ACXIVO_02225 [Glycocaulis sp.]
MRDKDGEEGYILLETLVAVSILTAAVLAAGLSIANAVSVADRASRSAASVDELRQSVRLSRDAARVCAISGGPSCMAGASGWISAHDSSGDVRAAHPPLASRDCHFDFVSRQCRPL